MKPQSAQTRHFGPLRDDPQDTLQHQLPWLSPSYPPSGEPTTVQPKLFQ